jgi:hypothetical protein
MEIEKTLGALNMLGAFLNQFITGEKDQRAAAINQKFSEKVQGEIETEYQYNPWFTPDFIKQAIKGLVKMLDQENLGQWAANYPLGKIRSQKNIGLILAGNIPFVGFHDLLCVLVGGHNAYCKMSSKDNRLFQTIIQTMMEIGPGFSERIKITESKLSGFDAVIATGSNNTSRYFEFYFGKYPHIIRKNRNSAAILTGKETQDDIRALSQDIFLYYGLGCRNVSKLFVPKGYNFNFLFENIEGFNHLTMHNKYMNNHDYYRSIYLVNQTPHLDNGFLIIKEDTALASPIAVTYYQEYETVQEVVEYLQADREYIQCIASQTDIGIETVKFGETQFPGLGDYADNIDTMDFLCAL